MDALFRAKESVSAGLRLVTAGELVNPDDPVMVGREHLFEEVTMPEIPDPSPGVQGKHRVNEVRPDAADPGSRRADVRRQRASHDYSDHTPEQVAQEAVDAAAQAGIDVSELEQGPGDAPVVPAAKVLEAEGLAEAESTAETDDERDLVMLAKDDIDPDDDTDPEDSDGQGSRPARRGRPRRS